MNDDRAAIGVWCIECKRPFGEVWSSSAGYGFRHSTLQDLICVSVYELRKTPEPDLPEAAQLVRELEQRARDGDRAARYALTGLHDLDATLEKLSETEAQLIEHSQSGDAAANDLVRHRNEMRDAINDWREKAAGALPYGHSHLLLKCAQRLEGILAGRKRRS